LVFDSDQRSLKLRADKHFEDSLREGKPLAIRLSIHTLGALIHELIPFYTGDCPISIVYANSNARVEHSADMVQGTLDSIQDSPDYTPDTRSAYVLIGRRR
jgi:precorrin-4 methylase